jgi:hypothetical protein
MGLCEMLGLRVCAQGNGSLRQSKRWIVPTPGRRRDDAETTHGGGGAGRFCQYLEKYA